MTPFFSTTPFNKVDLAQSINRSKRNIHIPEWFKNGIKFKGKWINDGNNICTLISFNPVTTLAEVNIKISETNDWTEDGWDLQVTIWGLQKGDYTLIEK